MKKIVLLLLPAFVLPTAVKAESYWLVIHSGGNGKALEKILPDAWISRDIKDAKAFINWVKSSSFYDLSYNDNHEAVKMINEIL